MNIHFLVESTATAYGGTGLAAQQLAQCLARNGASVTLHLLKDARPFWPREESSRLTWSHIPPMMVKRISYFWHLGRLDKEFAVVHIHGIWNPWWALAALIFTWRSIPFVVSPHGSLEPAALAYKAFKKKIGLMLYQRSVLNLCKVIVVTSEKEFKGLKALRFPCHKISIVPNGIVLTDSSDKKITLGAHGPAKFSTTSIKTFLYLSRIHPIKGLPMLIEAWAKSRRPNWRFVIAGHDELDHLAEVKALAASLGVLSDFEFLGPVRGEEKSALFDNADVFVLPTHSENFGIVIAEALNHGLPVITTRGAPWGLLESKGCGWWCDISADALRQALDAAMNLAPEALFSMGVRGRQWIKSSFDLNNIALDAINRVYLPLAKKYSTSEN